MKIRFLLLVFFLNYSFISIFAQAQKMSAAAIERFQQGMRKSTQVKSLEADFTQYRKVGYVKKEIQSSGKFYVKDSDKLAWHYSAPTTYSMIFKDKKMMLEEKGKKKTMDLSRSKQFETISQVIKSNRSDGGYAGKDFVPTYFQSNKYYILQLIPVDKRSKKAMKEMWISFDKATYSVVEIKLSDNSNGYTRFVFTNQKVNGAIADAIFEL